MQFFTEVCSSALEQRRPSWTVAKSSSECLDLFLRFDCSGLCFGWAITPDERRFRHASPLQPDIRPTSLLFLHFLRESPPESLIRFIKGGPCD